MVFFIFFVLSFSINASSIQSKPSKQWIQTTELNTIFSSNSPHQWIILYVFAKDCSFCYQLEKDVLKPFLKSNEAMDFLLRKIDIDAIRITNFQGKSQTAYQWLQHYNVKTTPTLLFLDPQGKVLHSPLFGYSPNTFYEYFLEKAIQRIKKKAQFK
jgi:thioredoxin-related protein